MNHRTINVFLKSFNPFLILLLQDGLRRLSGNEYVFCKSKFYRSNELSVILI